jgi:hypothetical protein
LPAQRIVMTQRHPSGPPMTLCNVRHLGVHRLVAYCLNPSCRHEGRIDVSKFANDVEVPSFAKKIVCAKGGARGGEPPPPKVQKIWEMSRPSKNQEGHFNGEH